MGRVLSKSAAILLFVSLACTVSPVLASKKDNMPSGPTDQKRALHALNRLTFGPRPGDVQRVMAIGVDRWIDQQLHPEKIDDRALDARLEPFRTTRMNTKELAENFPDGQEIEQVMKGKRPMPSDPALRMVYQVQIDRRQEKQEKKEQAAKSATSAVADRPTNAAPENVPTKPSPASYGTTMAADNAETNPPAMNGTTNATMNPRPGNDAAETADAKSSNDANDTAASATPPLKPTPEEEQQARQREQQLHTDLEIQELPSLPPDQRFNRILSLPESAQLELADSLKRGKGQDFLAGLNPRQKEVLLAMNNPNGVVTNELAQAKLLRAIYSDRQLEEVMTDFWFNHFNVFVDKGLDRLLVSSYERDVIRPHALGKFEDLLVATAKSPAMLFYLDNWLSVGPDSPQALGIPEHPRSPYDLRPHPNKKRPSGLNENYGRELLELHTLSVNGGYSQQDVTEVAKVFTGWTIDKPYQGGSFKYDPRMHEPGPKFVLGHRIKPKGEGEGLELLHRLATSPKTAHFISMKLAERFVSDDPPPALVDRMAKTFLKKKGDIRQVMTVLLHSPEFWDDSTYRDKVKTPLEFLASAVRATGADVEDAQPLVRQLNNMGMPLYGAQPPTGYSMKAETWVSSSALLNRMNFALALTSGKIKGVKLDVTTLAANPATNNSAASNTAISNSATNVPATNNPPTPPMDSALALSALETSLLAGDVSKQTHDSITAQMETSANNGKPTLPAKKPENRPDNKSAARKPQPAPRSPDVATMAGLLLGSPEFQRR
jgi:uncharacterized protein (DUF1800 family)